MESVEELKRQLEEKDKTIRELEETIDSMSREKEEMVENFKTSTNILIEKLKHQEELRTGVRPQTAQLLSDKRKQDMRMSALFDSQFASIEEEPDLPKNIKCHNCLKLFDEKTIKKHTITCYRAIVKCKVCGEFLMRNEIDQHLKPFRDLEAVKAQAINGEIQKVNQSFAHGFKVDTPYPNFYNFSRPRSLSAAAHRSRD